MTVEVLQPQKAHDMDMSDMQVRVLCCMRAHMLGRHKA